MQHPTSIIKFLSICFIALATTVNGQVEDYVNQTAGIDQEIDEYNQAKEAIEYKIRARECETETAQIIIDFKRELAVLDSLITVAELNQIPQLVAANKYLILSEFNPGDTCLYATYQKLKYLKGCTKPAVLMEVDLSPYGNLAEAKRKGKLFLSSIQTSGFTQVDKVSSASLTQKSADQLLNKIERLLSVYHDELGVTFDQYVTFEKKKDLKDIKDIILIRTTFLNKCSQKI